MKKIKILATSDLFKGFSNQDIEAILIDNQTYLKTFTKNSTIAVGDAPCESVGILIEGQVQIIKESASGNLSILRSLHQGDIFGEMAIFSANKKWPASVQSKTDSTVLFINIKAFFTEEKPLTFLREKLIYNMLSILSNRALYLNKRLNYLFLKTIREKIALYLLEEYNKNNTALFVASMNRNTLAEFLNITKPSLSRELGNLKAEGILDYSGNSFKIINLKKLQNILS
ncbi:Crp/Fnr family transcriptional regulator [endosymbiont 'TC1' of Trimyema compressum]|uniref:Crp/Fnr family transcriptional regulator n=1 Tax=endosymbiont 'TC1' of Trimyema compressum TaxID=243899 RepID=UPI001392457F|nr:Crp/Fnr family transcriptional regulator [endosymbiont 'TC1' of Trimyema compressum]